MTLRTLIVEDERPAREQLIAALRACRPDVEILGTPDSVADTLAWLESHPEPDLILADVRLTDGRSMSAFEAHPVRCPLLFVTAYDRYAIQALEAGGIAYLLKPVDTDALQRALDRVAALQAHFAARSADPPSRRAVPSLPARLLAHRAGAVHPIDLDDVAWITTEHRLVYLTTFTGQRYRLEQTLTELESQLAPRFLRIHRSWLVCVRAVRSFRSYGKGRLLLTLEPDAEAVVSADVVPRFREWLDRPAY